MGNEAQSAADSQSAVRPRVRFHYIKSNHFRAVHVDGAYGGVVPNGNIHCAVYSERSAIPQVTEHPVNDLGQLQGQEIVEGKAGFVRELDVDLIMSRQAATELRDWLTQKIDELAQKTASGDS